MSCCYRVVMSTQSLPSMKRATPEMMKPEGSPTLAIFNSHRSFSLSKLKYIGVSTVPCEYGSG